MIRRSQLFGFATIFLVGCGGVSTPPQSSAPTDSTAPASSAAAPAVPASPVPPKPLGTVTVPGVPGLVAQTNAKSRANGVAGGRVDPFAIVPSGPSVIPVKVITSTKPRLQPQTAVNPGTPLPANPLPTAASNPLPLPNLSPGTTSLPPANTPQLPPPSPTAIADRINITGVIQLQNKWHVIVQESPAGSSRYVKAGDTLAGGQVLIKRVIAGVDPLVVLQQNGKEVTRRIGSGLTPNV